MEPITLGPLVIRPFGLAFAAEQTQRFGIGRSGAGEMGETRHDGIERHSADHARSSQTFSKRKQS